MFITHNKEAVEKLQGNYLVLELETRKINSEEVTAWCIIDAEKISLMEIPLIETYKNLHIEFINNYNKGNYKFCLDAMEHLKGKFGGELDSFYEEIEKRIENK